MLRNHLRIGWRNIKRHKLYSSINIGGLALGLAVGILLLVWVQDELSYDRFHKNGDNIYRLSVTFTSGNDVQTWGGISAPVAPEAMKRIAGVQQGVRTGGNYDYWQYTVGEKRFFEVKSMYVDPAFFTMFSFPLIKGDASHPFLNSHSVVVTRSAALKYFGTEDAIGKIITGEKKDHFQVSGVMEDIPENSSIQEEIFLNFKLKNEKFVGNNSWASLDQDWGDFFYTTYLQLAPHTNVEKVARQLEALRPDRDAASNNMRFNVQPLRDIHLYNADMTEGGMKIVRIFLIVAIVILFIACVNYVNLSTARALQRAGEIGVRKMIGAARRQLFAQFLWESIQIFALALGIALISILLLIPFYNNVSGKQFSLGDGNLQLVFAVTIAMLLTLLVAGIYPAILLSSFNPLKTLKGKMSLGGNTVSFRKVLVVIQFIIATVLIISTLIVGQQLQYIRSKALGYDKENIFQFGIGNMGNHVASVMEELRAIPGVLSVSTADQDLVHLDGSTGDVEWDGMGKDESMIVHPIGADKDYLTAMKIKLATGRYFSGSPADSAHYVINETMAKMMGMKDPVGKRLKIWQTDGEIIGVVKDFHYSSLHEKIGPLVMLYRSQSYRMYVRTKGKDAAVAIAAAKRLYSQYNGEYPFSYNFLDDSLDQMYKTDQRTGKLFNYFAGIAIFISCLGLFGLATFATTQRIKEIGVRKVLGASITNIITLLTADFLKIVLIAIVLAVPIAWFTMNRWLEDYAYRVDLQWWVFAIAGILAVMIALFTVSFQSIKAALANPVKSLKTE